MNPNSLAAALQKISSDRRRALFLQKMARVWLALAAGLILYLLGARAFGWEAPFFMPMMIGLGVVAWFVVRASTNRLEFSLLDIAREVEAGDARLNSLLLAAYEEQQKAGPEGLTFLQERVVVEALEANRRSPWGQQFAERVFKKAVAHAGSVAVFVLALFLTASLGPRGKFLTALLGGITVTPGTTEVEKGTALAIMAKFPEPAPPEVRLLVIPKAGPVRNMPMDRALADPVFGASFPEVQEDFSYQVEYRNGKKTPEYKVSVFEYPTLRKADAHLTFPKFTGLTDKQIDDTHRVNAVEGTVIDYRLELNKPVRNASLVTKAGEKIALTKDEKFPNVYHAKIPLNESVKLALALKDDAGRTNKAPQEFALEAMPNKPPDMKIIFPRGDQRVSAIEEVSLQAEARDDFGMGSYGLAYSIGGGDAKFVKLGDQANANEKKAMAHLLRIEELGAEPDQLISYFAWAEDRGPDGELRRSESDMYFAEVRPFEEIFRKGNGGDQQQQQQEGGQQGGQQSPGEKLAELQKEIINATWKLQRTETKAKPSANFKKDVGVVHESQEKAHDQAEKMIEKINDPRMKAMAEGAASEMQKAADELSDSLAKNSAAPLPKALSSERAAYQSLLRLQAREYQVSRQRGKQGGGGGGAQQRAQRQLNELDLEEEKNRYETQSQASAQKSPEQQEQLQTLSRLKELSRRQNDVNEKLKELQASLTEAKTEAEKEELRRRLKRLREEQQDLVQDMDEMQQKMAQSQTQSQMSEARQQLEQARSEAQKASQQMDEKSMGQAASAGARSEKDLKKLTEDFRKATAQQFNDEMRDMRRNARDLADKEKEIAEKLEALKNPKQRTLGDSGGKEELSRQLNQQKTNFANIVDRMKKVSEQAETPEPLLAEKLYDTVRQLNQADTEKTLDQASEFLRRSFVPQASQLEDKARKNIEQLRKGVDEAANRLLGDEAEALRTAARELDDLARRVQNESRSLAGTNSINGGPAGGTNQVAQAGQGRGTNQLAQAGQGQGQGTNRIANAQGQGQNQRPRQVAQNEPSENGQPGEQGQGQQPGEQGQQGQRGQGQQGQRGQRGNRGQRGDQQQSPQEQQQQQQQQAGQNPGEGQQGGEGNQRDNFYNRVARENAGATRGGQPTGPSGNERGPITGENFRQWADQMRDVQEMIDDPDLRNELSGVLDRARNMRAEYLRHSVAPHWNLLEKEVLKPLVEVRQRVAEELARRDASQVAPLDRDPVPGRYAELVSRYYQSLGQGAPPQKVAEKPAK